MSVLIEFAMFPTDKGSSVSEYISPVIEMIRRDYPAYKLTAMGTIIETETVMEALSAVQKACNMLEAHSERIYATIKLDIQKNKMDRMQGKVSSIEQKIGEVKH